MNQPVPPATTLQPTPPSTSHDELDAALATLAANRDAWTRVGVKERIALLEEMINGVVAVAEPWAMASCAAEGIAPDAALSGEEWLVGPYLVLRNLRLLRTSLEDVAKEGRPRIPGPIRTRENGQVTAQVFPASLYDRLFYPGVTAEVWMEPGVSRQEALASQAKIYHEAPGAGAVALVLGAGNVSSIGPTDALYKFFVENRVVLYKMHPVNAYLGPLIERAFKPMVDRGFLRIVYGGAAEGQYLTDHALVDEIHVTGSHWTVEAIVFGPGEEGRRRKVARQPRFTKRITAELGNVSPMIVVPGPWTSAEIAYQAENLVSSLANNAGFNCNATRVMIQHEGWNQRHELLRAVRQLLAATPPRVAYYPGAHTRFDDFLAAHPEAETFGQRSAERLPWALIPELDPASPDEICFSTEAFCSVFSETAIAADGAADFLDRAVEFANDRVWGSLNVTLLVHPATLRDRATREAFERALQNLRYGTVAVNHWAGVSFGLMSTTWGAFPGRDVYDVGSGLGVVHNTLMFDHPQKSVLHAPFRAVPKPPWFVSHGNVRNVAQVLADFESEPSLWKLPGVFWHALRP